MACLLAAGCGDENGGSAPGPVKGVSLTPSSATIKLGHSLELTATVAGGHNMGLTWYVNGYKDGNEVVGTITANSPATYVAPESLPDPAVVVIKAVSVEEPAMLDSSTITLTSGAIHVDARRGNDNSGTGTINHPFKTITHALSVADSAMTVLAAPGTYAEAGGEVFPLDLPNDVTLEGENWETCILSGNEGETSAASAVDIRSERSTIRKFTIRDHANSGMERWLAAIWLHSCSGCRVDSIRFVERSRYACIRIDGQQASNATANVVEDCFMDVRSDPVTSDMFNRGFEIVFDDVDTVVRSCTVYGFNTGLFFNYSSNALIEGCVIEHNSTGASICCGEAEISDPKPDFGGGARGSMGGNTIRNNGGCGLLNTGRQTIYAKGNIWNNDPPVEDEDFCNPGAGSIILEE
jgi:hypothetical protein